MISLIVSQIANLFVYNIFYLAILFLLKLAPNSTLHGDIFVIVPIIIYLNTTLNFGANQIILAHSKSEGFDVDVEYSNYLIRAFLLLIFSFFLVSWYLIDRGVNAQWLIIIFLSVFHSIISPYWMSVLGFPWYIDLIKLLISAAGVIFIYFNINDFGWKDFFVIQLIQVALLIFIFAQLKLIKVSKLNLSIFQGLLSFGKFYKTGLSIQLSVLVSSIFPIVLMIYVNPEDASNFFVIDRIRYLVLSITFPISMAMMSKAQLSTESYSKSTMGVFYGLYSLFVLAILILFSKSIISNFKLQSDLYYEMMIALALSLISSYVGNVMLLGKLRDRKYFISLLISSLIFILSCSLVFVFLNFNFVYIPIYIFEISLILLFCFVK